MIRLAIDTNVFLSAFLFGGFPARVLALAAAGTFRLLTSPILLDELEEKLRFKFNWTPARATELRHKLEELCDVISTTEYVSFIKADPDDDRLLECALDGRADYIVSGDKHLLNLVRFRGIPVVTVRRILDIATPSA